MVVSGITIGGNIEKRETGANSEIDTTIITPIIDYFNNLSNRLSSVMVTSRTELHGPFSFHEICYHVNRQWEHNCRILFCRNSVESLKKKD